MLVAERDRRDEIDAAASQWLARRRLTSLSPAEEAAFEAWRRADPRHRAAFERMGRTLEDVSALTALAELEPLEAAPRRALFARSSAPTRRRAVAAGLGAVAAGLVALVAVPGLLDPPDLQEATRVAEVRQIALSDGSRITLGARSRIKVDFDGQARRVQLTDGEAFFEVAHDAARPFFVDTGGTVVRVVGTKFDVKRGAGRVEVSVLQGVVEVRGRDLLPGGEVTRTLRAGQRVRAVQPQIGALAAPLAQVGAVEAAPGTSGAWRDGQLTYDDTRLEDLVADLNRYYAPGVRLRAGAQADTRLAVSFKVHELDKFLRELPSVMPVVVTKDPDGAVTITQRPGTPSAG